MHDTRKGEKAPYTGPCRWNVLGVDFVESVRVVSERVKGNEFTTVERQETRECVLLDFGQKPPIALYKPLQN